MGKVLLIVWIAWKDTTVAEMALLYRLTNAMLDISVNEVKSYQIHLLQPSLVVLALQGITALMVLHRHLNVLLEPTIHFIYSQNVLLARQVIFVQKDRLTTLCAPKAAIAPMGK